MGSASRRKAQTRTLRSRIGTDGACTTCGADAVVYARTPAPKEVDGRLAIVRQFACAKDRPDLERSVTAARRAGLVVQLRAWPDIRASLEGSVP